MNQPSGDQYIYKYSGGMGTYCAKHQPFAVYCAEAEKTFFCYGGSKEDDSRQLLHMVSYFDHKTMAVPRPTILLDKRTSDAHDNPVISIDEDGYIWIFSTSHGTSRPSYIHCSKRPFEVDEFERVRATRADANEELEITNFSYMQAWHTPNQGFACFFTEYQAPGARTICFMSSKDGSSWNPVQRLAAVEEGHYQISAVGKAKAGSAFNYHPRGKGLNWRTNLYYLETPDFGKTWQSVSADHVQLPLSESGNAALVHDYESEGLNVYLKDIQYDAQDRPVILYLTSGGYQSGPENDPRTWKTARWTGTEWEIRSAMNSDNNYDMGSIWVSKDDIWQIIAPTSTGPQPFNPGGEIIKWESNDHGQTWEKLRTFTKNSVFNHNYVRRPVDAHPDFYAIWTDGHGRKPSVSTLYFANRDGSVFELPRKMESAFAKPKKIMLDEWSTQLPLGEKGK
ncbi:BNR-4 repeat-containing protein [Bythopirellula polymerisocia]|nr:BNR-4 repeat-containing protein [Bythopirellula polymerisocia]